MNRPVSDPTKSFDPSQAAVDARQLAWEADRIAEAEADVAAGRLIDEVEIDAWISSIGTDEELPPPRVPG